MAGPNTACYFTRNTFKFLSALALNNKSDWFGEHKHEYEEYVRAPALAFITDITDDLSRISPHFTAQAKKVGGSLMRVYRDVRFGKDKTPYKTNIGIQFRHEVGKDLHAPGFYVHIAPGDCFLGVGMWRPDATALAQVRDAIVAQPKAWRLARDQKTFKNKFSLVGGSLSRPPRGYAADHPLLEDLKRKDFIAISALKQKDVLANDFQDTVVKQFQQAIPFMRFLCNALELRF